MKRREFIALAGGAAAAWPLAVRAQAAVPIVGFMAAGSRAALRDELEAFEAGLKQLGFFPGQNVALEYRFAAGQYERFQELAADLVRRQVSVLAVSSPPGALAAKRATTTIPIVFSIGADPVAAGLVPTLSRPGGNITGIYQFTTGLEAKRLGLLHEMIPKVETIGVLVNPTYPAADSQIRDVGEAAKSLRVQLVIVRANKENEFDAAFSTVVAQRAGAHKRTTPERVARQAHGRMSDRCLLYPRKRTSLSVMGMSAKCQKRTYRAAANLTRLPRRLGQ